jgi:hypothetical protein
LGDFPFLQGKVSPPNHLGEGKKSDPPQFWQSTPISADPIGYIYICIYITSCVVAKFSLFIFGSIPSFLATVSPYFDGLQIPLLKTESPLDQMCAIFFGHVVG